MRSCVLCLTNLLRSDGRSRTGSWEWGASAPCMQEGGEVPSSPCPFCVVHLDSRTGQEVIIASRAIPRTNSGEQKDQIQIVTDTWTFQLNTALCTTVVICLKMPQQWVCEETS